MSTTNTLIVGVSEYKVSGAQDLHACTRDAELMRAALHRDCFIKTADMKVMSGEVTVENFSTQLDLALSHHSNTLIVYFSGHGYLSESGGVSLVLSDGLLSASTIIERCRKSSRTSWLIFDMCHAGAISFKVDYLDELNAKASAGCALFASCAPDMMSYIDPGSSCSAFTKMLVRAMGIAQCREGAKSLSDIEHALRYLVKIRNQSTDCPQQPLLLHSSVGPIMFHDPSFIPYQWQANKLPETDFFEVLRVEPCFADRKRYICKVLMKDPTDRESLMRELPKLISKLRNYEVYDTSLQQQKWEACPTQVLFIYLALSKKDFVNGLFSHCVIWSEMGRSEKLGRGEWHGDAQCWIDELWTPSALNMMRQHYENGSINDAVAIQQTKDALREISITASELFLEGDQWLGGIISTDEFSEKIAADQERIEESLELALRIGYPSQRLRPLENQIIDLAGALRDLPLFFLGKGRIGRSDENLEDCFLLTKRRYDSARMKIAEIVELELSILESGPKQPSQVK